MMRLPLELSLTCSGSFQWTGYGRWYGNCELHYSLEGYLTKGLDGFVFVDQGSVFSTFPQRVDMLSVGPA